MRILYILFFTTHLCFGQIDSTKCALIEEEFQKIADSKDKDLILRSLNDLIMCDASDGFWVQTKGQFMKQIGELDSAMDCFMHAYLFCGLITAAEKAIDLLIEHKQYESALLVIGNAIKDSKTDHNKAVFYALRGQVEAHLKMYYLANNDYKTAYNYNPSELIYLQEMILLQLDVRDPKKGIEYLLELEQKDSVNNLFGFIQQNLGYFHLIAENYDSAIHYMKPLVWRTDSIDITTAYVHNNLARAYLEVNNIDSATQHIEYALELDSLNGAAFYNSAFIHMAKEDTLSACHDLSESKKLGYEAHGKNKSIEQVIADYCVGYTVFIKF